MNALPTPDCPPLILMIPAARVESLPAAVAQALPHCDAHYHAGVWFVSVPADVYRLWPEKVIR